MSVDKGMEIEVALGRRHKKSEQERAPVAPKIHRVTRLMALAIKFQDMIDRGEVRDFADLARLGYVSRARVTQIMNLLLLAPTIQEQILLGSSSTPERYLRAIKQIFWQQQLSSWIAQPRKLLFAPGRARVTGKLQYIPGRLVRTARLRIGSGWNSKIGSPRPSGVRSSA